MTYCVSQLATHKKYRHNALLYTQSEWCHDTQYYDIQHNDTRHSGLIFNTQHKWYSAQQLSVSSAVVLSATFLSKLMLNVVIVSVVRLNAVVLV